MSVKTKFDDNYWRKMTWDWYAVPRVRDASYGRDRSKGVQGGLRCCPKCDVVYSVDTNKGGSKRYKQFNYLGLFRRGVKIDDCKKCRGEFVSVVEV